MALNPSCETSHQVPYAPSALRSFANSTSSACTAAEISTERFSRCFNVHSDSSHQLNRELHTQFCTKQQDRRLVHSDGLNDIQDAIRSSFVMLHVRINQAHFCFCQGNRHGMPLRHNVPRFRHQSRVGFIDPLGSRQHSN